MRRMVCLGLVLLSTVVWANEADTFFDDSQVQEIRLTFDDPNWLTTLIQGHGKDPNDPYFPAVFTFNGTTLDEVGVRFRGSAAFDPNAVKNPLKINFQKYDGDSFLGLDSMTLSNLYDDPSCLREKLFWDVAAEVGPAVRAVHVRVYVNDTYLGLYLALEEVDKDFVQRQFGQDEDGNLYESDPNNSLLADLTFLGLDKDSYDGLYDLRTNEDDDDYTQLIELINILNNADLPASLELLLDVNEVLDTLAINNLFVNLDSYLGSTENYFLYDRDDTGQFVHLLWDADKAFGLATDYLTTGLAPVQLPPLWLPSNGTETLDRPLAERLWAVDDYRQTYLQRLSQLQREVFDANAFATRVQTLADLIESDLDADENKFFTLDQFEQNLSEDVTTDLGTLPGLMTFAADRYAALNLQLDTYAQVEDLEFSEVLVLNVATSVDQAGDADAWVELYNPGPGLLNLAGLGLSDDVNDPLQWTLPDVNLDDGEYLIVWLDGETAEGDLHSSFVFASGSLVLSDVNGVVFDQIDVPTLEADESYGRVDGVDQVLDRPTPGAANVWTYVPPMLYINEVMADNDSTIEDPDDEGSYEDWVEIYNGEDYEVDLSGMQLTDDPEIPTQWEIPQGVTIPGNGYVVFWLDKDTDEGDLHADFKLSKSGEAVGLYDTDEHDNQVIDLVEFGKQTTDVSYGRNGDGAAQWRLTANPTPGTANTVY